MISIAAFPKKGSEYTECLYEALGKKEIKVLEGDFSGAWIIKNAKKIDYFHFHWPSFAYAYRNDRVKTIHRFFRFVILLILIKLFGSKIIWTAHNLYPHEKSGLLIVDKLARHTIILFSSIIFVHGFSAANIVAQEFPRTTKKIVVIDHGAWIDHYKNDSSMTSARRKIDVPSDEFVYLFIGNCLRYKKIHVLVENFKKISRNTMLIIAGQFQDVHYYEQINKLIKGREKNIRIEPKYIPDDDLQYYLNACNVVVLPYTEILTSGTAMFSIGFGRPVIAPRIGYLQDVINEECGVLYDPKDMNGLLKAMEEVQKRHFDEKQILEHALSFDWHKIAEKVLNAIL